MAGSNSSNSQNSLLDLSLTCHQVPLPRIAALLGERYPGVRIVSAVVAERHDNELQQSIRYQAPLALLQKHGLVVPTMLRTKGRKAITPIGDGFHLSDGLDCRSVAGCHDLFIYTGATPRDNSRVGVGLAKKALRKFLRAGETSHG